MAQGHLQRRDEPGRRAHRPDARPRLRAPRPARARQRPRRRGEGGRGGAGHRARRRSRGAHRPRRAAGRRLRPQGEHAPGRRSPARDRDRLPERRHRALRARARCPHAAERRRDPLVKALEASWQPLPQTWPSSTGGTRTYAPRWRSTTSTPSSSPGASTAGFEGAVTYLSGFQIVHRYAYVVVPRDAVPLVVFPTRRATSASTGRRLEQVFHDRPGELIAERARPAGARRRLRARLRHDGARLPGARGSRPRSVRRRVRSRAGGQERGRARVRRDSVRINERGFEVFLDAYEPGKTAAEVMAAAEEWFVDEAAAA